MENEQTPEQEPERLVNECSGCGHLQYMTDDNTIIFQASEDKEFYAYVKCDMECEQGAETIHIEPELIHYFGYFTNWYNEDGRIPELQITGHILGTIEIAPKKEWGEIMLEFLEVYQPEAWEYQKWQR